MPSKCRHTPDNDGHCHNCGVLLNLDYHEVSGCPCQTPAFKKRTRKKVLLIVERVVAEIQEAGKRIPDHTSAILADLRALSQIGGRAKSEKKAISSAANGRLSKNGGRPPIQDEFTDLPISRQAKQQRRKRRG